MKRNCLFSVASVWNCTHWWYLVFIMLGVAAIPARAGLLSWNRGRCYNTHWYLPHEEGLEVWHKYTLGTFHVILWHAEGSSALLQPSCLLEPSMTLTIAWISLISYERKKKQTKTTVEYIYYQVVKVPDAFWQHRNSKNYSLCTARLQLCLSRFCNCIFSVILTLLFLYMNLLKWYPNDCLHTCHTQFICS